MKNIIEIDLEHTNLVSVREELEKVQNLKTLMETRIMELESVKSQEILNKIQSLPEYLSVGTLDEVFDLIKKTRNNQVHAPKIVPFRRISRSGKKIEPSIKTEVIQLLRTRQFTTAQISRKLSISPAAVNKLKGAIGMVRKHGIAA
jgi:hypothetical protein